jgi:hypothetical protein
LTVQSAINARTERAIVAERFGKRVAAKIEIDRIHCARPSGIRHGARSTCRAFELACGDEHDRAPSAFATARLHRKRVEDAFH